MFDGQCRNPPLLSCILDVPSLKGFTAFNDFCPDSLKDKDTNVYLAAFTWLKKRLISFELRN